MCMSGKLCICQESCVYMREQGSCLYVREVVCMRGGVCVCQGSCVYMREVVCMSGKLCAYEGSCVDVREVVCLSGVFSRSSSLKCLFRF